MSTPSYLFVEIAGEYSGQESLLREVAAAVTAGGGVVQAWGAAARIACLEPGTVASGIVLARFAEPSQAGATARQQVVPLIQARTAPTSRPLVLQVQGLPEEGLPEMLEIPTVASVPAPPPGLLNALMVIRGSVFDQPRVDGYRDVILPMLKQRGGFYEVFALDPAQFQPLLGEWQERIFAVSRWPDRAAALDFWLSTRYQEEAIPLRVGAGRFSVHLLDALQNEATDG